MKINWTLSVEGLDAEVKGSFEAGDNWTDEDISDMVADSASGYIEMIWEKEEE